MGIIFRGVWLMQRSNAEIKWFLEKDSSELRPSMEDWVCQPQCSLAHELLIPEVREGIQRSVFPTK